MTGTRLIVLDRDGVLNEMLDAGGKHRGPWSTSELTLISGVESAVAAAAAAGYRIVVATNQPDIARDWVSQEAVDAINSLMAESMPAIEHFYMCTHDNGDACNCRKPKPGMLLDAAADVGAEPENSWMIGDRWTDIGAGEAAGFRTALIFSDRSMKATHHGDKAPDVHPDLTVATLAEAIDAIIRRDDAEK